MGRRSRVMLATAVVVAVPAATIRLLHGLADRPWFQIEYGDLGGWLQRTSLTDAFAAVARLAALVLAYYLLVSTLLYLVAVTSGSRHLIMVTRPLALPIVRSLADRLIAGSIAIGTLATPLLASTPPPPDISPDIGLSAETSADYLPPSRMVDAVDATRLGGDPPAPDAPPAEAIAFTERPTTRTPATPEEQPATVDVGGVVEVLVGPGDHMWGLAEQRIERALGRAPFDHETAPYWREVVEENRNRIRSGNPDLIHPGEMLIMPDPSPFIPSGS